MLEDDDMPEPALVAAEGRKRPKTDGRRRVRTELTSRRSFGDLREKRAFNEAKRSQAGAEA